jgi:hypothetical protein
MADLPSCPHHYQLLSELLLLYLILFSAEIMMGHFTLLYPAVYWMTRDKAEVIQKENRIMTADNQASK